MKSRLHLGLSVALALTVLLAGRSFAQQAQVNLSASPNVILADGRSSTTITATISGLDGNPVADGTIVRFSTTDGILSAQSVASVAAIARTTLTSSPVPGFATLTATFVGSNGSGTGQIKIEFTSDKTLANTDVGQSDWIRISSNDYLAYSADSLVVDSSAPKQGVIFGYRGLVIKADALQADIATGTLRARNATMQRGKNKVSFLLLSYNIASGEGQALSSEVTGARTVQPVSFNGRTLQVSPIPKSELQPAGFTFVDISGSRVVVTAKAVAIKLNDRIQLRHASIFVDSKRIVSLPYQIMPLNGAAIFGQQVIGYGSDGLFLDIPYYASVSPTSTEAFYLRSVDASEQDGTYYSGRRGLSVDYVEKYSTYDDRSAGTLTLMGISRGDWGVSWTHSQQFNPSLHGYFYLDLPEHNSLFLSSNLAQQFHGFSLNVTTTDENSPVQQGYSDRQQSIESYLQTDAHKLAGTKRHGLFYSEDYTVQGTVSNITVPGSTTKEWLSAKSAGLNLSPPLCVFLRLHS